MAQKALIADDEEVTLLMIKKILQHNAFDVTTVMDGEAAINMARKNDYDLIITDISMPKVEGIEVIAEIVKISENTKIIAITSEGSAGYTSFLDLAETVGASASLKKPFTPTDLMDTISDIALRKKNR